MVKLTAAILMISVAVISSQAQDAPVTKTQLALVNTTAVPLTERFEHAVEGWISELAKQPEFAHWSSASWTRTPLGPGMHGWIVLVTIDGKEAGYLVVTSDTDNVFSLVEYGAGAYPLFSESKLYQELVQQSLIHPSDTYEATPAYYSPFQTVWQVTHRGEELWLDGASGELLSLETHVREALNERELTLSSTYAERIERTQELPAHDPYKNISWVTAPPTKIKDLQQLQAFLDEGQTLTFVTEQYVCTILYAFALTGYHQWSEDGPFIRIEQDGSRFIPAERLLHEGKLYVAQGERELH